MSLDQAQQLYAQAETALAQIDDPRTDVNMKLLRARRLNDLESGVYKLQLTELEDSRLRNYLTRTMELRRRAASIVANLLGQELSRVHMNTGFSPAAIPRARNFRQLLTPLGYLGPLASDMRTILQLVEKKLELNGPNN